ncbi:MAG TPA: HAD-IA family hydrolase [Bryobacteraceae bacterium]|nr:HAD-IA family hydrolase [Bryobacteraceae bacterium]
MKQRVPLFNVYLFDVDGTLMDSARDICGAVQHVLRACGRDEVEDAFLRRYIGRHLIDLFLDLGYPREGIDQMIADYRVNYHSRKHSSTSVIPGVAEMLAGLGGRKSTATTKGTPTTRAVLEQFGLAQYFDHVQGTDGFPAKPEPDVVMKSLAVLGAAPEECLLVGDAPADMEAGRRAGVKICAARYGYGDPAELEKWQPDYWIDDPRDLLG